MKKFQRPKGKKYSKARKNNNDTPSDPAPVSLPAKGFTKIFEFVGKKWKVVLGVGAIIGILANIGKIAEYFKSKKDTFEENHIAKGRINAHEISQDYQMESDTFETETIFTRARTGNFPPVNGIRLIDKESSNHEIMFMAGSGMWRVPHGRLKKGITFTNLVNSTDCNTSKIKLVARNNRLYVSAEFRDLQNNVLVGKMDFNRWEVYLDNLLDYKYDDDRIEVRDKQGYIIFAVGLFQENQGPNGGIVIRGYFQNPKTIMMMNNSKTIEVMLKGPDGRLIPSAEYYKCISKEDPAWKSKSEEYIDKIESVF